MKTNALRRMATWLAVSAGTTLTLAAAPTLKVGDSAPKLQTGKWVQGEPVKEFQKGKAYLVEFWATWCPPCRASVPGIEKIYESFKDKGVVVLAVSMDDGGWDAVQSFVKENGIKYTVLKGNEDVAQKYQVRSIPMLLVLDKEGKISKRYLGFGSDEDLDRDIKAIL